MAKYSADYRWSFRVNKHLSSKERIGAFLRDLATRIDGRWSLAIRIETAPKISLSEEVACVKHGLAAMEFAIEDSARVAACEALMEAHPTVKWG